MAFRTDAGALPVDSMGRSVQEFVDFQLVDTSASPQVSPIAAGTGNDEVAITMPALLDVVNGPHLRT